MPRSAFKNCADKFEVEYRAMTPAQRQVELEELREEFLGYHDNIAETLDCKMLEGCFLDTQERMRILCSIMTAQGEQGAGCDNLPGRDCANG